MTDHPPHLTRGWLDWATFAVNLLLLPVLSIAVLVTIPAHLCYLLAWWCRPQPSARLTSQNS